jgi:exonuclease SbcC
VATLKSVSDRLGAKAPSVRISARDLSSSIAKLETEQRTLHEKVEAEVISQAAVEKKATDAISELLGELDADDLDNLADYLAEAKGRERDANKEAEQAAEHVQAAKRLNQQLGIGGQLVDDLDELRTILSKFIAEVLTRRSQALLAVAGQRLGEMTGDRYAFTKDFDVLDQLTGQPRGADTLSGGESFLASLSLALGMVDLAARAGGRLDALFLDEGFGALDNANLNAAVDALEATSEEGRMVAVISHVKAVADRIEDVMLVLGDPKGSRTVWLDEAERSDIGDQDIATAMRGLLD